MIGSPSEHETKMKRRLKILWVRSNICSNWKRKSIKTAGILKATVINSRFKVQCSTCGLARLSASIRKLHVDKEPWQFEKKKRKEKQIIILALNKLNVYINS